MKVENHSILGLNAGFTVDAGDSHICQPIVRVSYRIQAQLLLLQRTKLLVDGAEAHYSVQMPDHNVLGTTSGDDESRNGRYANNDF